MVEIQKMLPNIIVNYLNVKFPRVEQFAWEYINPQYEEEEEWNCDVYHIQTDSNSIYIVLTKSGMVREATPSEIHFLMTGEVPEENDDHSSSRV